MKKNTKPQNLQDELDRIEQDSTALAGFAGGFDELTAALDERLDKLEKGEAVLDQEIQQIAKEGREQLAEEAIAVADQLDALEE